jgi:hypothetical protein
VAAFAIFPLVGIHSSPLQNIHAVFWFTVVSILRNYIVRRVFNWRSP